MATSCLDTNEKAFFLNPSAKGADMVQKVVSKLHSLQIVTCGRCLLRRIAFVETEDGTRMNQGGIWALDESKFKIIAIEVDEVLNSSKLCLSVNDSTPYTILNRPLVSGLAAALYLNHLKNNTSVRIPLPGNIEEQAQFWKAYYTSRKLTVKDFVEKVENFECKFMYMI